MFLRRYRVPLLFIVLGVALVTSLVAVVALATSTTSNSSPAPAQPYSAPLDAVPTNHVTGSGSATVRLHGNTATVTLTTSGLLGGSPHLAHIHGLGLGTCPTAASARLHQGHLSISTGDAIRLYGSTLVSFTEWGSTSGSVPTNIDLNRYPASGNIHYERTMTVPKLAADLIRDHDAVIVVHGIDYNYNHIYDFQALGVSDLDRTLPGEATAPALCGALRPALNSKVAAGNTTTYVASLRPDVPSPAGPAVLSPAASASAAGGRAGGVVRVDGILLYCHIA